MNETDERSGVWCLVANFSAPGTKHFRTGAKAYCLPPCNGTGYEAIAILGYHRGSPHRLTKMMIGSKHLENWRARVVYHPHAVALAKGWEDAYLAPSLEGAQAKVEYVVRLMIHRAMARHTNTWLHSTEGDRAMELNYGQSLTEDQEDAIARMLRQTRTRPIEASGSIEMLDGLTGGAMTNIELQLLKRAMSRRYGLPQ